MSIGNRQWVNTLDGQRRFSWKITRSSKGAPDGIVQIHDMSRVTNNLPSGVLAFRYSLLSK